MGKTNLQIAAELISKTRGEEQSKLIGDALKHWNWVTISKAITEYKNK